MKKSLKQQQIEPEIVLDFPENTLPLKELEDNTLRELSRQYISYFHPKDTLIFQQDITDLAYLSIIQQGGTQLFEEWRRRSDPAQLGQAISPPRPLPTARTTLP